MTVHAISPIHGEGGVGVPDSGKILREIQGLTFTVVAGATAGTKMDVAALRKEDTLLAAIITTDAGGALANDVANMTIQETRATGTITVSGNPVADETFVVNGNTYTFKATPTALNHVKIATGDNNAIAANISAAINAYETRRLSNGAQNTPAVTATVASNVVTVTSVVDGAGNGIALTSSDGTDLAVSGNGTAAGTITAAAVDNDDYFTLNGVTFTAKASPSGYQQFKTENGDNTLQALKIAQAINLYEKVYGTLGVTATPASAVVNLALNRPKEGNIITLTESATNVGVSGSGTLANGTATGGVKSSTNLSSKSVILVWYNKNP